MSRPPSFPMLPLTHPTLEDYRQRLTMSNYTAYTIRDYSKFLRRVLGFNHKTSVRSLTQVDINLFLQYLQQEGISPRSIYKYVCASRNLIDTYRLNIDRRDLPKVRQHIEPKFTYLAPEQVSNIISVQLNIRNKALIALAHECALRVGEVCAVLVGDLDLANSALLVRSEKWGPKATIPILNPEITRLLHEYLLEWDPRGDSPLFPMRMGHRYPLKTKYVSRTIFKEAARRLGYDKVRFHDLRHSRATDLFNAGIDSLYIKSFMRHRSMASTQGYVHITTDSMRTILKQKLPKGIYTQTSMYYPL